MIKVFIDDSANEHRELIELLDIATKSGGLPVAQKALKFVSRVNIAIMDAQKEITEEQQNGDEPENVVREAIDKAKKNIGSPLSDRK